MTSMISTSPAVAVRYEYRFATLPTDEHAHEDPPVLDWLNGLGREGWRVAAMDLTTHPSYAKRPVTVLLERELAR
jgi:hypothetical protein